MDKDIKRLQDNWNDFIERGVINEDVNPYVARSWTKCRQLGVNPNYGIGQKVSPDVFESIREANRNLIDISLPIMHSVFDIVESSHFLLVLTDSAGYVLETIGDQAIADAASDLRFEKGSLWSDAQVGTNALSVCLDFDVAIQMIGPEHYCVSHQAWCCSAAPIHGLSGEVIGCLNLSGEYKNAHSHTLGVVEAAAFGIEQQLFSLYNAQLMRTALDSNPEAILLLDEQFHPVWLNTSARKTLGIEPEMLAGTDFRELMPAIDWTQIEHWATDTRFFSENSSLIIGDRTIYCGVNITSSLMELNKRAFSVNIKKQEQVLVAVNALSGNRASYTFNDLSSINPTMLKAISIARRFASYDGNVLIEGEIGTGKEIFAQAIHNASTRFDSPYVTINCAALPRAQVEGELFGYEKGFAPGSREEGYPGKLELANGGTVFLSEIAELPLEYQAELLQVVQNRIVRRVGALQDKELDIRLIVASSRNMRHEVDSGRFRQDLFTSLNVLRLDIVPLRNRPEDIGYLSQRILDYFNDRYPNQHKSMTESFKKILFGYHWPGNTRELQNCIECAFYASEDEDTLGEDLLVNISPMTVRQQSWQNPTREASQPGAPSPLESELNHGLEVNRYPESELGKVTSEASWNGTNTPDIELWDTAEREGIIAALTKARGDVGKAADALNMSRATLYRRIHQFHIDARQIRRMNS